MIAQNASYEDQFLTTTAASKLIRKSPSTVKRLAKRLWETKPNNSEILKREKTYTGYIYKLSKQYLLSHFSTISLDEINKQESNNSVLQLIRAQFEEKDRIIEEKDKEIKRLNEFIISSLSKLK